jgi:hypothetical protein
MSMATSSCLSARHQNTRTSHGVNGHRPSYSPVEIGGRLLAPRRHEPGNRRRRGSPRPRSAEDVVTTPTRARALAPRATCQTWRCSSPPRFRGQLPGGKAGPSPPSSDTTRDLASEFPRGPACVEGHQPCEEGDSNQPHGARHSEVSGGTDGISGTCDACGRRETRQSELLGGAGVTVSLAACVAGSARSSLEEPIGAALAVALDRWRAGGDRALVERDLEGALRLIRREG